jgi:hypothetical protein
VCHADVPPNVRLIGPLGLTQTAGRWDTEGVILRSPCVLSQAAVIELTRFQGWCTPRCRSGACLRLPVPSFGRGVLSSAGEDGSPKISRCVGRPRMQDHWLSDAPRESFGLCGCSGWWVRATSPVTGRSELVHSVILVTELANVASTGRRSVWCQGSDRRSGGLMSRLDGPKGTADDAAMAFW